MPEKSINSKDAPIENDNGSAHTVKITVSKETKAKFMLCKPEFLKHHPELTGMKITENFLASQIFEFYLKA